MNPKVSIIVPCYRVEKYLDRCLNSLVSQTLRDIEIILIDDLSPDKTPEICDNWVKKSLNREIVDGKQLPVIKVIHKDKNEGLGFARNTGLHVAEGEYVTFCDSDDYVEIDAYETLYNAAKSNNLDICYCKHRRFLEDGRHIEVCRDSKKYFFSGKDEINDFKLCMIGWSPMKSAYSNFEMSVCMGLFRLSTIKETGIAFLSERVVASEDLVFHIHLLPHIGRVGILPNVFYNYYINPCSITTTFNEAKYQRLMKLLELVKTELLKMHSWEEIKGHYYSQQLRIIKIVLNYESNALASLKERIARIRRHCEEPLFHDIYNDNIIKQYPCIDRIILTCMKKELILPIIVLYKYVRKYVR